MSAEEIFDVVVVGGGPAGATAATDLARMGRKVALLDKAGRIKPCGGAIPPRLVRDFAIPDHLLKARVNSARMISPSAQSVDMPIKGGFVGMVDREEFDEWLRVRAAKEGATRVTGAYEKITRERDGGVIVHYEAKDAGSSALRTKLVIGADGALSQVGRQEVPGADKTRFVFAYHEIVQAGAGRRRREPLRDPLLRGVVSGFLRLDFSAWRYDERGRGERPKGLLAKIVGERLAGGGGPQGKSDFAQGRGSYTAQTPATLG